MDLAGAHGEAEDGVAATTTTLADQGTALDGAMGQVLRGLREAA